MALVIRLHQGPRRFTRARALDHVAHGLLVGIPFLAVAPVFFRDLELLEGHLRALFKTAQLLVAAGLQPELDHDDAGRTELVFEVVDLVVGAQPVVFAAKAFHALDQHAPVPGAVKNGQVPTARQVMPEAPQIGLGLLGLVGRGHRHDLVLPGIQRRRNAPDGAALAGRIRAFERADHGTVLEARIARQLEQAGLPARQLTLVLALLQLQRQVQLGQHIAAVGVHAHHRGHRRVRRLRGGQAGADRVQHHLAHRQVAVAVVAAVQHHPRCLRRVGHAQHVARSILQLVKGLEAVPVPLRHAPGGARVARQRLQALTLRVLGQVEPELQHQCAFVGQHGLEAVDLVGTRVQLLE